MRQYRRETRYVSVLTVHVPDASALVDMMRYDRCCPADEDQSRKIERLINLDKSSVDPTPSDHVIRLLRYAATANAATSERWRSFGCVVLDERSPDDIQLTDVEAECLVKVKVRV